MQVQWSHRRNIAKKREGANNNSPLSSPVMDTLYSARMETDSSRTPNGSAVSARLCKWR